VPLAVEVRERRKLESHEAQRGARGLRDGHGTEAAGGAFDFGTGYKPFWIQFQNARPPENEHTEFGTLPIWNKCCVGRGASNEHAGNGGRPENPNGHTIRIPSPIDLHAAAILYLSHIVIR
jgi:hypothetical protein